MSDVLVVGCGLIGTSLGLALRGSALNDVTLEDADNDARMGAVARGAGRPWDGLEGADVVVIAVPPGNTAHTLLEVQRLNVGRTYTHVASVQSQVEGEVERLSSDPTRVVGGHPLAGREVSGRQGARSDLFLGRPWAICPGATTATDAVEDVHRLVRACGGSPVVISAAEHDRAVALMSHVPQVVSSALAALLVASADASDPAPVALSGPGLSDTTRLAASSPSLWTQIVTANAHHIAPRLSDLTSSLEHVTRALERLAELPDDPDVRVAATEAVEALLVLGNRGRALVPVKRGVAAEAFATVRVDVADEPGQLAGLLASAGAAGVNVEDVHVDHVPGRARGVIELLVAARSERTLAVALVDAGWHVVVST